MKLKFIYGLIGMLLLAGCGFEPEVSNGSAPALTATDILSTKGYSILQEALDITGIDLGSGPVTLFAPSNDAFQKLFAQLDVKSISEVDAATLSEILKYHVVSGELLSADITPGSQTTLQGANLYLVVGTDGALNVNGKAVVDDEDRDLSNTSGVIHGINQVLSIPSQTLTGFVSGNDNYEILAAAITTAGLADMFNGLSKSYTIFAPNDAAFEFVGLTKDVVESLTAETLVEVLSFHVVENITFSQQLPAAAKLTTLLGAEADGQEELVFSGGGFATYLSGSTNSTSSIVSTNILATNGVIHGVDNVILPQGTIFDFVDPNSNTPRSSGDDAAGNALDNIGTIITGLGYARLTSITDTTTLFVPADAPDYASFGNDDDATAFLEAHTFEGRTSFAGLLNGSKVTSIGGDEYYIGKNEDGAVFVNGRVFNLVRPGFVYDMYNGNVFRFTGTFEPLPEDGIVDILEAQGFGLMAAAIEATGKDKSLDAGDKTFLTVSDALFTGATGLSDAAAIRALDATDEDDAALLEALSGVIDDHTVSSVNFGVYVSTAFPTLMNVSGDELSFGQNDGNLVIILDDKDPDNSSVGIVDGDILYSNGTIHVLDTVLDF